MFCFIMVFVSDSDVGRTLKSHDKLTEDEKPKAPLGEVNL